MNASLNRPASFRPKPAVGFSRKTFVILLGIIAPLATILYEAFEHTASQIFFDPLPTWLHIPILATVPLANLWLFRVLLRVREEQKRDPHGVAALTTPTTAPSGNARTALSALTGFAAAVSVVYGILFLPFLPIILLGLAFFWTGYGLLALLPASPFTAALAIWRMTRRLRKDGFTMNRPAFWLGGAAAAILLLGFLTAELQRNAFLKNLIDGEMADIETIETRIPESTLVRIAKRGSNPVPDFTEFGLTGVNWRNNPHCISRHDGAKALFRYYGRTVERETRGFFDTDPGWRTFGTAGHTWIGSLRHDLHLAESSMEGWADADAGLGYIEWTQILQNNANWNQEGRQHIQLPPGGVVSRVTLWVKGDPREAAFETVSKAREAYEYIVQRNRDPVLVNHIAQDIIQVESFPVPPQGTMKYRIGITFPLPPTNTPPTDPATPAPPPVAATFKLPYILNHNFKIQDSHSLKLDCEQPINDLKPVGVITQNGTIPLAAPMRLTIPRDPTIQDVAALDGVSQQPVIARLQNIPPPENAPIAIVIDGSAPINEHLAELQALQTAIPPSDHVHYYLTDRTAPLDRPLAATDFSGGTDAVPMLDRAARWLNTHDTQGTLLWFHGAQPFAFAKNQTLCEVLAVRPLNVHAVRLDAGHNLTLENLQTHGIVTVLKDSRNPTASAEKALQETIDDISGWRWSTEWAKTANRTDENAELPVTSTSDHLARLHVFGEIMDALGRERLTHAQRDDLAQKAIAYELVTPVSAAIVLETREDYERHGIVPPEDRKGPTGTIPEPSTLLLVLLGASLLFLRRRMTQEV